MKKEFNKWLQMQNLEGSHNLEDFSTCAYTSNGYYEVSYVDIFFVAIWF